MIRKWKRYALLAMLLAALLGAASPAAKAEPTSHLPRSHRAYDFLTRMEHVFPEIRPLPGSRPITRIEAARMLVILSPKRGYMTAADREELLCLLAEFQDDYLPRGSGLANDPGPVERLPDFLEDHIYRNRRNLYSTKSDHYSLYLDPVIVRSASVGKLHGGGDDDVYTSTNGLIVRGTIGNHLGYHIDVRDSREWGSRDYPEDTSATLPGTGFASFKGDHAEFDETNAQITWNDGPFTVSFGRGRNVWGRGRRGSLMLSDYGAPYDMLRLEADFWRLRFTFFTAELEQYPPLAEYYYSSPPGIPADSVAVKKYMSGHRLEIDLGERLQLGLQETVVFGGRWDMTYLNPVMFLKGAEHANGDHDNAAMGADFRFFVHRSHSVYGELLIDDITTTKLGTDWYGNKIAWQLGTFIVAPFGFRDMDARLEYSRLSPWVYTHRHQINTYTHYGDVLGHRAGPNADEFHAELRRRFSRRLHVSLAWTAGRHGENTTGRNVGGDPLAGFMPGDSKKAAFLAGRVVKSSTVQAAVSYEILWRLILRAGYAFEDVDGDGVNIFNLSLGLNQ